MNLKPGDEQAFIWVNDKGEPDVVTLSPSSKVAAWMALNAHAARRLEWPADMDVLQRVLRESVGGRIVPVKMALEEYSDDV